MEGVDETGVEELWGPKAGKEGGDVLLGGDPPNLDIMIMGQPEIHCCIEDLRRELWQPVIAAEHID